MNTIIRLFLIYFILAPKVLSANTANANPIIYDTAYLKGIKHLDLIPFTYVNELYKYEDNRYKEAFEPLYQNYGLTKPSKVRIWIKNLDRETESYVFKATDINILKLEILTVNESGNHIRYLTGINIPFKQKLANAGITSTVKLDIPYNEALLVEFTYSEFTSFYGLKPLDPTIYSFSYWNDSIAVSNLFDKIFIGILLLLIVLGISILIASIERSVIFYLFYLVATLQAVAFRSGLLNQFIFTENPKVSLVITVLMAHFGLIALLLFVKSFLNISKSVRKNRLFNFSIGIIFFNVIVTALGLVFQKMDLSESAYPMFFSAFISSIALSSTLGYLKKDIENSNKVIMAGLLLLTVALFFGSLQSIFMGNTLQSIYFFAYGQFIEVIIFSVALVLRMREALLDKQKAQLSLIEQLQANEKLQNEINTQLEKKVKERTYQLENTAEELKVSNEKLEETTSQLVKSNSTKDKFFSIVAHDLKSPIISLKSLVLLLNSSEISKDTQKRAFQLLNIELSAVSNLLDNLLLWSIKQKEEIKFIPEEFFISEVIKDLEFIYKSEFELKKIHFINEVDESLLIHTDHNMFQFILRNLVSNALKFTPKNGTIKVYTKQLCNSTEIHVSDTGIGIEDHKKELIFHEQYSEKGTNNEKGTGLGLNLSKEFAEKIQAKLQFTNNKNEGVTFSLVLDR